MLWPPPTDFNFVFILIFYSLQFRGVLGGKVLENNNTNVLVGTEFYCTRNVKYHWL